MFDCTLSFTPYSGQFSQGRLDLAHGRALRVHSSIVALVNLIGILFCEVLILAGAPVVQTMVMTLM